MKGSWSTLWGVSQGQRLRYGVAILAMAVANVLIFAVPVVTKDVLDHVVVSDGSPGPGLLTRAAEWGVGTSGQLGLALAAVVLITALAGVCLYARGRWVAQASESTVRTLRNKLLSHLESLPCTYYDGAETGDLVQRCSSDVDTVRVFLTGQVVEIGRAVLLVATALPIMLLLSPRMTAVSVVLYPVILVAAVIFFRRIKTLFQETDEAEGAMTAVMQENLTGIRVVRAFARQEFECDKFALKNQRYRDLHHRLIRLLGTYWGFSDLLCLGQIGLVLVFGAFWLAQGLVTVGDLFAFWQIELTVIWPVRHLGRVLMDSGKAVVALGRIREILNEEPESNRDAVAGEGALENLRGDIRVEHLDFAYGDGNATLEDVSFEVREGQTLAVIGAPGSGKSTLISLLLRLYDAPVGTIRLDGHELSTLSRRLVRSQVGVVLQEPFLYSKSIGANVRVGRRSASAEEMVESARDACIHGSIENFPDGYETLVGERGVTLSGGQRQRLAIARALLKDPAILVLDDALSAVDTRTESHILEALRRRHGRRTTIIIAHRLSSVLHADRILVLERGRVVQSGSHHELCQEPGTYRRLWQIQSETEAEIAREIKRGTDVPVQEGRVS